MLRVQKWSGEKAEVEEILTICDDDERQEIASMIAEVGLKVTQAAAATEALQAQLTANRAEQQALAVAAAAPAPPPPELSIPPADTAAVSAPVPAAASTDPHVQEINALVADFEQELAGSTDPAKRAEVEQSLGEARAMLAEAQAKAAGDTTFSAVLHPDPAQGFGMGMEILPDPAKPSVARVVVQAVAPSGPAHAAGMRDGDTLLAMAGVPFPEGLDQAALAAVSQRAQESAGQLVGQGQGVEFQLRRPAPAPAPAPASDLFSPSARAPAPAAAAAADPAPAATEFTLSLRKTEHGFGINLGDLEGRLLVTGVQAGFDAAAHVREGDEILSVAGVRIGGRGQAALGEAQEAMSTQAVGTMIEWQFAREATPTPRPPQPTLDLVPGAEAAEGGGASPELAEAYKVKAEIEGMLAMDAEAFKAQYGEVDRSEFEAALAETEQEIATLLAGGAAAAPAAAAAVEPTTSALLEVEDEAGAQLEFVEGVLSAAVATGQDPYEALFSAIDLDKNGYLTIQEVYEYCDRMQLQFTEADIDDIFAELGVRPPPVPPSSSSLGLSCVVVRSHSAMCTWAVARLDGRHRHHDVPAGLGAVGRAGAPGQIIRRAGARPRLL